GEGGGHGVGHGTQVPQYPSGTKPPPAISASRALSSSSKPPSLVAVVIRFKLSIAYLQSLRLGQSGGRQTLASSLARSGPKRLVLGAVACSQGRRQQPDGQQTHIVSYPSPLPGGRRPPQWTGISTPFADHDRLARDAAVGSTTSRKQLLTRIRQEDGAVQAEGELHVVVAPQGAGNLGLLCGAVAASYE